ncbi:MAG: 16S rRNA (guanine(527)-N(7))-methyltransferase RsmG [Cyanobacteria bacterium P01_A01_bin.45]
MLPSLSQLAHIWQETLKWKPTSEQQEKFERLYRLILEGNRQLNLTRITEPQEFWEKHLWDSLRGLAPILSAEEIQQSQENSQTSTQTSATRIIDIGTGAGFPGIPAAIVISDCMVTLVDSTHKKVTFINNIIPHLELANVETIASRIEEIGQNNQYREVYDIATLRAVAAGSACAEYALPLLKKGGLGIIYRGNWTKEEHIDLEKAVKILGGTIECVERFTTPLSKSIRHCLYLRKIGPTPMKFPRPAGVPTHKAIA